MTDLSAGRARQIVEKFREKKVVVVGDAMVDRFVWGEVHRISPEAPVPVVRVEGQTDRPGGAANVAANLVRLGANAVLISATGEDEAAWSLKSLLAEEGVEAHLVAESGRATPLKTRVIARSQQVVRVDRETDEPLGESARERVRARLLEAVERADALVVSDYDKGVVGAELLAAILPVAAKAAVPVVVDPKPRNFPHYTPATVMTPNQREAGQMAGIEIRTEADCLEAARAILGRLELRAVVVTRGPRGILLLERGERARAIPTAAREVFDVTGAGDTVAAVLALGLASGASLPEAAILANFAAGIVVGKVGTATASPEELVARVAGGA